MILAESGSTDTSLLALFGLVVVALAVFVIVKAFGPKD